MSSAGTTSQERSNPKAGESHDVLTQDIERRQPPLRPGKELHRVVGKGRERGEGSKETRQQQHPCLGPEHSASLGRDCQESKKEATDPIDRENTPGESAPTPALNPTGKQIARQGAEGASDEQESE